jgi:hypothetical protein
MPAAEVLLTAEILVGGDQEIEFHRLSHLNELAILQLTPTTLEGRLDHVPFERVAKRSWRPLIEEELQIASGRNGQALAGVLQHRIDLRPSNTRKPLQELDDGGTPLEILKKGADGHPRPPEQPFSADLAWDALYG